MKLLPRLLLIAASAVVTLSLVILLNWDKVRSWRDRSDISRSVFDPEYAPAARQSLAEKDEAASQDDDDEAPVELLSPPDPGNRAQIADMNRQIATLPEDQWLRQFELTDTEGQPIGTEDLLGQPFIACFFFSTCPGSCRAQTDQMRLLQTKYRNLPVRLVSITVDPEIDTPETLAAYAEAAGAIDDKWYFLTGELKQIQKIANEIFFLGQVQRRGHPDRFCLVGPDGRLVGKYNWHDAEELKLLDEHLREVLPATEGK